MHGCFTHSGLVTPPYPTVYKVSRRAVFPKPTPHHTTPHHLFSYITDISQKPTQSKTTMEDDIPEPAPPYSPSGKELESLQETALAPVENNATQANVAILYQLLKIRVLGQVYITLDEEYPFDDEYNHKRNVCVGKIKSIMQLIEQGDPDDRDVYISFHHAVQERLPDMISRTSAALNVSSHLQVPYDPVRGQAGMRAVMERLTSAAVEAMREHEDSMRNRPS